MAAVTSAMINKMNPTGKESASPGGQTADKAVVKKEVLIVDDSRTMRSLIKDAISGYKDFTVIEAEDGQDGVEKMKQHDIKLIFLDYNMPRMNGIEFMQHVRSVAEWKKIPIIMLTTESEEAKVKNGYVAGATVYATKPFDPKALGKIVDAMRYWHIK